MDVELKFVQCDQAIESLCSNFLNRRYFLGSGMHMYLWLSETARLWINQSNSMRKWPDEVFVLLQLERGWPKCIEVHIVGKQFECVVQRSIFFDRVPQICPHWECFQGSSHVRVFHRSQ